MSAFDDLHRLFSRGIQMRAYGRALSRARLGGRGPVGPNAWTEDEVRALLLFYDEESKSLPIKRDGSWDFLGKGDRSRDSESTQKIDALRRAVWILIRNANAPTTMAYVWAGVSEAWAASNQHAGNPWTEAAIQYASAAMEAAQEGREETVEEFARWAVWAAWAARYHPDDRYLEYQAWLSVIREAGKLVAGHLTILTDAETSRTKAETLKAEETIERSSYIVYEELQRQRDKGWSLPEIRKRRTKLAGELEYLREYERAAESMLEEMGLEEALSRIAMSAGSCISIARHALEAAGFQILAMDAAWAPLVGSAVVRIWTPLPTERSFGPRHPALTEAQAGRLGDATNVAALVVAFQRVRLDADIAYLKSTVLTGQDALKYFDGAQEAREGVSGREVYAGQVIGHLTSLLTAWWACKAAARALKETSVDKMPHYMGFNETIIRMNNEKAIEEAVWSLRKLVAG